MGAEWLPALDQKGMWALHEYSAFFLFPISLLVSLGRRGWSWLRAGSASLRPGRHPLAPLVAIYFLSACAFASDDFSPFAPFSVVNRYLFSDSLHVVGRYCVAVALALALTTALQLRRLGPTSLGPRSCMLLLGLLILNVMSFSWMLDLRRAADLWPLPAQGDGAMRVWRWVELYPSGSARRLGNELLKQTASQMYPVLRAGEGVINCSNPLSIPSLPVGLRGGRT
jgi:hypothetical protein